MDETTKRTAGSATVVALPYFAKTSHTCVDFCLGVHAIQTSATEQNTLDRFVHLQDEIFLY